LTENASGIPADGKVAGMTAGQMPDYGQNKLRGQDMNIRSRDLYDSSSVLSNWENEGGATASVLQSASRYAPDDIVRSFGESVVAHWNELPHGFKQLVFQEIESNCKEGGAGLKKRAARFLHDNCAQLLKRENLSVWMVPTPHAEEPSARVKSLDDFDKGTT